MGDFEKNSTTKSAPVFGKDNVKMELREFIDEKMDLWYIV
jgi:hypothetical protein